MRVIAALPDPSAPLSRDAAAAAFAAILDGEVADAEIAAFLVNLSERGESAIEIAAAARALRSRMLPIAAPAGAIDALRDREFAVPLIAMTYYNLVYRHGPARFAADLAAAGLSATILPDLPFEAAEEWLSSADEQGIENVLLAAPVSSDERLAMLGEHTKGFLYVVSTMGTTGERDLLDEAASVLAQRVQATTAVPVLFGFGISTPEHAVTAARVSDGVITASVLMRTLLNGGTIDDVAAQVAAMRAGLDA